MDVVLFSNEPITMKLERLVFGYNIFDNVLKRNIVI